MTTVALTMWDYAGATDLTLFLYSESDASNTIVNSLGDALTPGSEGSFTASVSEPLSGVYNVVVKQVGAVVAQGGKVRFDGNSVVFVDSSAVAQVGTGGSGANPLVITVGNGASAVSGAVVSAKMGGIVLAWGYTNGAGQLTFLLASGTYSIEIQSQPGYVVQAPANVAVPSSSALAITLTPQSLAPPAAAGLCTVRFIVLDNGTPVSGAAVSAEIEDNNPTTSNALVSKIKHSGVTDASGICDLVMIQKGSFTRGGVYKILAYDAQGKKLHDRRVVVPALSTAFAEDLPDAN